MDSSNLSTEVGPGDIETNPVGDVTADEPMSSKLAPADLKNLGPIDDLTANGTEKSELAISENKVIQGETLDEVIIKALEKVKDYFFRNEIEENRLAEVMYKILTLNTKDVDSNNFKMNPEVLNKLVDQIVETSRAKNGPESLNDLLENLFGVDGAKSISQQLCTVKIDEIVECLLGKDTKNIICDRLESENLDELLNKLIDEKLSVHGDPLAKHPNFDDFIDKILGKDTKEFIRKKLQAFLNENENNKYSEVD